MYIIIKIFYIRDGIKSILSLKINIFIFNNILFYYTDFCTNYHIKYNIFFLHIFLNVHNTQYLLYYLSYNIT